MGPVISKEAVQDRLDWVTEWLKGLSDMDRLVATGHLVAYLFATDDGFITTVSTMRRQAARALRQGGVPRQQIQLAAGLSRPQLDRLLKEAIGDEGDQAA
jgi:hypothetical protein